MQRITKSAFRKLSSVSLGRDGVLEVMSHGSVAGYWMPHNEWVRREEERNRCLAACKSAVDIIGWMSGSADFVPGGQAHVGWIKAQPAIASIRAIAKEEGDDAPPTSGRTTTGNG